MKSIIFLLIFILFLLFYTRYIERRSIFFPFKEIEATPQDIDLLFEDIYFYTADGEKLNAWYVPAEVKNNGKVLLFFHGNGGNISHRLEKIAIFNELGMDTFIIDYRGYGRSTGSPTEKGIYLDSQAAYDYLTKGKAIKPENIIVYGESLGGAAAIDLASKNELAALITEETFTCAKDMSKAVYPFLPTIFLSVHFDSISKIAKVGCPKLIIHSRNDEIVPFRLGKKLFQEARQPKDFLTISGAHNNAFFDSRDLFVGKLKDFLDKL